MRHQIVRLGLRETFLDGALDANKTGTELILGQFANGTHTAVAKVIDIVDLPTTIAQFNENLDDFYNVTGRQGQLVTNFAIYAKTFQQITQCICIFLGEILGNRTHAEGQLGQQQFNRLRRTSCDFNDGIDDGFSFGSRSMLDHYLEFSDILANKPSVEFHPADGREIVTVVGIKQTIEQDFDGLFGWRLSRTHHAVDGDTRSLL